MRINVALFALLAVTAMGAAVGVQHSAAELSQITARGRALYAYDTTASVAAAAVQARFGKQAPPVVPAGSRLLYIGRPSFNGWVFDFGTLTSDGSAFTVIYRAMQAGPGVPTFDVTRPDLPAETPFDMEAARAITVAMGDFQFARTSNPYNYAALQRADGNWYVYIYPGWTSTHEHPLGDDERYVISSDGTQMLDRHRMHDAILDRAMPATLPNGVPPVGSFHTDTVEGVPEDSDVLDVLIRGAPEYISAQGHLYKVNADGSIVDFAQSASPAPSPP